MKNKQPTPKNTISPARRKRINRLKKLIVRAVLLMILLLSVGCVILGIRLFQMKKEADAMSAQVTGLKEALREALDAEERAKSLLAINEEIRQADGMERQEESADAPTAAGSGMEGQENVRNVYLTFDDGPSIYTNEILDILAEQEVKATFFVTGKDKEGYGDVYRRIVEEGHTLGMHSYSHVYSSVYASLSSFQQDLETLRDFLYRETGVVSSFYRFPGGSSNSVSQTDIQDMIAYLDAMDITYFDWNISSGDATSAYLDSEQIISRVMAELPAHTTAVVLLHDTSAKRSTVEALPELIRRIKEYDDHTVLLPITEDTPPIQHVQKK